MAKLKYRIRSERPSPVPPGWSLVNTPYESWTKGTEHAGLTVRFVAGEHWEWQAWAPAFPWQTLTAGEASSRLAAMRKAELYVHMRRKVNHGSDPVC